MSCCGGCKRSNYAVVGQDVPVRSDVPPFAYSGMSPLDPSLTK